MLDASQDVIPKKIHYCWLSGDPLPQNILECMETWRTVLPDYEIIRWDLDRFDAASVRFVAEACERRKWAFASDYIRLFAIQNEGGIYLDSDVRVLKSLDPLLSHKMFVPIEYHPRLVKQMEASKFLDAERRPIDALSYIPGIGIQAAIFGGQAGGHPFLKACMDFYEARSFVQHDGSLFTDPIAPGIYAKIAERYGFTYKDETQHLDGGVDILASRYFASSPSHPRKDAFAVHCCEGTWRERPKTSVTRKVVSRMKRNLRKLFGG